ncbi:MAG: DUF1549 domain-containing protein [Candidatus Hydrogenedentes bacterium]|nr:DUF1549 domain-containing protein [Candidatus Hydrogenedentota bacterium]
MGSLRVAVSKGLFGALLISIAMAGGAASAQEDPLVFYRDSIKPILAEHCFKCHGGGEKVKGDFTLTTRAGLIKGAARGPAVDFDDPDASVLLAMLSHKDEHHEMPPAGKLPDDQIALLTQWVLLGAPYDEEGVPAAPAEPALNEINELTRQYWAYQPVKRPAVPEVQDAGWVRNPVDAFVLHGLEKAGLTPAPPASRGALVRRVYYDLLGLPPTPEQVEAFVNDARPDAYAQLVEQLLASPHYGEKWGRHWLDLVGYAETNGYERDGEKPYMWRYRDYVVNAFNQDMPYDQFIREQIAGDELDTVTPDTITATGFHRLGIWDDEPADPELARYDVLDNVVDTAGQVFLGTTMGCARCHDHKIDPIPQRDYYRFLAFFNNLTEMKRNDANSVLSSILTPEEQAGFDAAMRAKNEKLEALRAEQFALREAFILQRDAHSGNAAGGAAMQSGLSNLRYEFYRNTWDAIPDFSGFKPEATGGLPRNFVTLGPASRDDAIGLVYAGQLQTPRSGEYTFRLRATAAARLSIDGQLAVEADTATLPESTAMITLGEGLRAFRLEYINRSEMPVLELYWSGSDMPERALSVARDAVPPADLDKTIRDEARQLMGAEWYFNYKKNARLLAEAEAIAVEGRWATAVQETGGVPRATHMLVRGNPHVPGSEVTPGYPEILNPPEPVIPEPKPGAPTTGRRRVLASWLASAENPLTARVMANRIWQYHFGRGIVRSSNNFGRMGIQPTHPELLDWIATEFVAGGWRIKDMHRLMMLSSTYQMSAEGNSAGLEKDPMNHLFWRFNMRRLTAEELRDSILAVNGSINLKMGGPSVYPPMPAEVLATSSMPGSVWKDSPPEEYTRRSLYIHVKRSLLMPLLADYDLADTDDTCPVRFVTTQPGQALNMINSEFIFKEAAQFAQRLRAEAGSDTEACVTRGLHLATGRAPRPEETARGLQLISELAQQHQLDAETALERFCLLALNLNEFVFLD